jgi:uncharacterized protein (UPF0303 family)
MNLQDDMERLALQESRLVFSAFNHATAWELGHRLQQEGVKAGAALAIEVRLVKETVFFCAMPGTRPGNADWIRRKRNTVELLQRSSYAVGRAMAKEATTLQAKLDLPLRDYASHGGCFPIFVKDVGCVGCVTVSGLPEREDHALVVRILAELCQVPVEEVALA